MELAPWSFWNQTADWTEDGNADENRLNNCGPECVSMTVMHLMDMELPADYVHDTIKGQGYVGYTSLADLALFFTRYAHTNATILYPNSQAEWGWHIWKALTLGHPLIGLFSFSAPGSADGHFRCIIGMASNGTIITADPNGGRRRVEDAATLWTWAKGPLIHIKRKRAVQQ